MKQRQRSTAKLVRRQVSLDFPKPNGRWRGPAVPDQPDSESEKTKNVPGKQAQAEGEKLKRGAAIPIVCYPRRITRAMLVHASELTGRSLSSFMIRASLKEAAAIKGVQVEDLIPPDEYQQYR